MYTAQRNLPHLRQTATAHLAQTMNLLSLSRAELNQWLNSVLASNPALELVKPARCPTCHRPLYLPGPCPVCHAPSDQPIVFLSPPPVSSASGDHLEDLPEPAQPEGLRERLMKQIGPELDAEQHPVAVYLLARLDENGLLSESPAEAAKYLHKPLALIERTLHSIQRGDPPGIGASSPVEALLIQVEQLGETKPVPDGVRSIIQDYLEELGRGEYGTIARQLGISRARVEQAARFIHLNLTPYPGRAYLGTDHTRASPEPDRYTDAEMTFRLSPHEPNGPLIVEVFAPLAARLHVSTEFREALRALEGDERDNWEAKVEQAALVEKCLRQSQNTLLRLARTLAEEQRQFILGTDRDLKPLTRASVAKLLGLHESTISRAVSRKRAGLPNGRIVPLSKFFDRSLSVRDEVRAIIAGESEPLTDTKVAGMLRERGIPVARRTIAKYRAMEGILPAALRKVQRAQREAARPGS
ncbi:MAG: hypothetical protein ABSG98_03350 [Anaerolineales bacterium]|jgi:RNA polymerase sigma-54 factor